MLCFLTNGSVLNSHVSIFSMDVVHISGGYIDTMEMWSSFFCHIILVDKAKVRKRTYPKRAGCPHGDNRPTRCPAHRQAVITEVRSLSPPSGAHRRWPGLEAVGMNLFTTLSIFDFREPHVE